MDTNTQRGSSHDILVKERGVADREAGISMRSWGWLAYKKRDAVLCPNCGAVVIPGGAPGTFDFPEVQIHRGLAIQKIAVEVKAGGTRFPFSELRKNQREWAESCDVPTYIWLCLGRQSPLGKMEPRITYFFSYRMFMQLEKSLDRKSIPYGLEELEPYRLIWRGDKHWEMPMDHPFRREERNK